MDAANETNDAVESSTAIVSASDHTSELELDDKGMTPSGGAFETNDENTSADDNSSMDDDGSGGGDDGDRTAEELRNDHFGHCHESREGGEWRDFI